MPFVGELAKEAHHLALSTGVQSRGRLVEIEERRPCEKLSSHRNALTLAAAETDDGHVSPSRESQCLDDVFDAFAPLSGCRVRWEPEPSRVVECGLNCQFLVDYVVLRDVAKVCAISIKVAVEVGAVAYWPPGSALCLFWGATPMSSPGEIRPASAVNVIGSIDGDPTVLGQVIEGTEIVVVKSRE